MHSPQQWLSRRCISSMYHLVLSGVCCVCTLEHDRRQQQQQQHIVIITIPKIPFSLHTPAICAVFSLNAQHFAGMAGTAAAAAAIATRMKRQNTAPRAISKTICEVLTFVVGALHLCPAKWRAHNLQWFSMLQLTRIEQPTPNE